MTNLGNKYLLLFPVSQSWGVVLNCDFSSGNLNQR